MHRLKVIHTTEYGFAGVVTLEPHRLLLRPREGHDIRVMSSKLDISPQYDIKWHRDAHDNSVAVVSFKEPTSYLSIRSEIALEHYEEAPLDFVVEDYAVNFPFEYRYSEQPDLAPYRRPSYPEDEFVVRDWLSSLGLGQGGLQTYVLLDRLSRTIAGIFAYVVREEPGVQRPRQTIEGGSGSCRDYATLFIECCRHLGLACRFVSGYLHAPSSEAGNASTHAWAEAYLPGAGWKGFDPTSGELTAAQHIPVAVARHPESIPPVSGSFFGSAQIPKLTVGVQVTAL